MQMMQQGLLHGTCAAMRANAPLEVSFVAIGRRVGHSHCSLVWRTGASWCCREPLALESVTQSALISVFPEFHERWKDVADKDASQKKSLLAMLVV